MSKKIAVRLLDQDYEAMMLCLHEGEGISEFIREAVDRLIESRLLWDSHE